MNLVLDCRFAASCVAWERGLLALVDVRRASRPPSQILYLKVFSDSLLGAILQVKRQS